MKIMVQWKGPASWLLLSSLAWILCLQSIERGWSQDTAGNPQTASPQAEDFLDLRGDVPSPQRIDPAGLRKLPRIEIRTTDPHDPGREIVYSGTPLVEVLKAGGLLLDPDMARIRETVKMSVLVEAADGYRALFSLAELDPELTDRVVLLADPKDGQAISSRDGPFRIIVPGEKRPVRWVRQVRTLTVRKN
jgi:hypothetical protein